MSDRLTLVSSHGLARASARKRAYTPHETNTETITERGDDGCDAAPLPGGEVVPQRRNAKGKRKTERR